MALRSGEGVAEGEPGAMPSLPPSHCEGQGRRPAAAVTRPSRPITGLCQSEAGKRGRASGHCGASPVPVLAPPRSWLTCWGCRRRRRHSRRGLNHSPRPHFRGPRGPPPGAGCDTPPTSGSRNGAHALVPLPRWAPRGPLSHDSDPPTQPDTPAAARDHTHGEAREAPPARQTPGPAPGRDTAPEAEPRPP